MPGFLSIIAALDLARETALQFLQPLFPSDERARIFESVSITGNGKGFNPNVNTDLGFDLLERFYIGFDQDADEVSVALVLADRQVNELRIRRKRATPRDIERLGLFGESDLTVSIRESVRRVANGLAIMSRFELRIVRSLLKKVRERHIKIAQRLLEHDGTDFGEKGFFRFLLPLCQFCRSHMIADRLFFLLPGDSSILQRLIVNVSSATECPCELRRLLVSRKESVFERLLDYHEGILYYTGAYCKAY